MTANASGVGVGKKYFLFFACAPCSPRALRSHSCARFASARKTFGEKNKTSVDRLIFNLRLSHSHCRYGQEETNFAL